MNGDDRDDFHFIREENSMDRRLPIGNDQFRSVREKNEYYIDKSLFIKEFLEKKIRRR